MILVMIGPPGRAQKIAHIPQIKLKRNEFERKLGSDSSNEREKLQSEKNEYVLK